MSSRRVALILALVLTVLTGVSGLPHTPAAVAQTAARAVVEPRLLTALSAADGPVEVIVTFWGDGAPSAGMIDLLRQAGITAGVTLRALPIAGVLATAAQVEALAARPEVRSLYLNRPLAYENAEATALTGVDRVRTDPTLTGMNGGLPVSGTGVAVLVNDSGVDGTHKDLEFSRHLVQNVAGAANLHALSDLLPITYVENVPNTDSTGGHGTHVAGIVGATGAMSGGKYEGVAPGADLVGYGSGAALVILDTLGGFDYALWHQAEYRIRVITNSWGDTGDTGTPFDPHHPVNVATKKAFDRNIAVIFSAGNSGPGESTITGNYKKAPWVITVAAGDKQGRLASFSSRGLKEQGGTVTADGQAWTWEDRPTVTAPGVAIVSTRVVAPVSSLGVAADLEIEPAYLPYYTTMQGTSMAAPHVAGIVALMLEANPRLTPLEVKQILQETATNVPGGEPWEVGAGYVNGYAAVDRAFRQRSYGMTVNLTRTFNSDAIIQTTRTPFSISFDPFSLSSNRMEFTVPAGLTELVAKAKAKGVLEQTGNTLNLVLTAPDGTHHSSGVSVLFALYPDRTVSVTAPTPGIWTLELKGIGTGSAALPETVQGMLTFKRDGGYTGLGDIAGHPAEASIRLAVSERLVDGDSLKKFRPGEQLTRRELAEYLTMGAEIRQFLPLNGSATFADVKAEDLPFAEAVAARGAALRDQAQSGRGVMLPTGSGSFSPTQPVRRKDLAYSLVQSLGLEAEALARNNAELTVHYGQARIPIEDAADVPPELRGYVQLALDLNILNAYFYTTQGPYDLQPVVHAVFIPLQKVSRADYAVAITRFYSTYLID